MGLVWRILGVVLGGTVFWVIPIWLGLRAAHRKHHSALWMWFGIHPLGGWITFAVLASLPALKTCPRCAEKVKAAAKVYRFCQHPFEA